jgi:hypothetical protein
VSWLGITSHLLNSCWRCGQESAFHFISIQELHFQAINAERDSSGLFMCLCKFFLRFQFIVIANCHWVLPIMDVSKIGSNSIEKQCERWRTVIPESVLPAAEPSDWSLFEIIVIDQRKRKSNWCGRWLHSKHCNLWRKLKIVKQTIRSFRSFQFKTQTLKFLSILESAAWKWRDSKLSWKF